MQEEDRYKHFFLEESKLPHIPDVAKFYQPVSERLLTIALPRLKDPEAINPLEDTDPYAVKAGALKGLLLPRLNEISRPRSRYLRQDIYDAYKVSEKALKAVCSSRVKELSLPLAVKRITKKADTKPKKTPFRL